jgi:hypothetical protein
MGFSDDEVTRLRELLDKQSIQEVILRYCRGIDRMDRSLVRSCYHDDALDLHGSFSGGPDEYVDWAFRVIARHAATFHFIGNVLIELEGPRARAESYGISIHTSLSDEPERNLMIGFRYVDRFEKRDGDWRIAKRVATTDWTRVAPPEDQWPLPDGIPVGRRDRRDPVYEPLG